MPSSTRYVGDLQFDAAGNRLIFSDVKWSGVGSANDNIYAVDLATAQQTPVSNSTVGSGSSFNQSFFFILDPADKPTRAIVSNANAHNILSVDLSTGDRTLFGAVPSQWSSPGALFMDTARDRIIGFDFYGYSVFEMPLAGGACRTLSGLDVDSSDSIGHGPMLIQGYGMDIDDTAAVAYLAQISAVVAVDLLTGDRVLISH